LARNVFSFHLAAPNVGRSQPSAVQLTGAVPVAAFRIESRPATPVYRPIPTPNRQMAQPKIKAGKSKEYAYADLVRDKKKKSDRYLQAIETADEIPKVAAIKLLKDSDISSPYLHLNICGHCDPNHHH
jgi:hypothetical protein